MKYLMQSLSVLHRLPPAFIPEMAKIYSEAGRKLNLLVRDQGVYPVTLGERLWIQQQKT